MIQQLAGLGWYFLAFFGAVSLGLWAYVAVRSGILGQHRACGCCGEPAQSVWREDVG